MNETEKARRRMAVGGWFFDGSGYSFKPRYEEKELQDYLKSVLPRAPIKKKPLKFYEL